MEKYVSKTLDLLKIEHEEEVQQIQIQIQSESPTKCETLGLSILNLEVLSISTLLFGRTGIELKYVNSKALPSTFRVGDEVTLQFAPIDPEISGNIDGIITKASSEMIEVTVENMEGLDDSLNASQSTLRLNRRASDVTYKKLCASLQNLSKVVNYHRLAQLIMNSSTKEILPVPERIPLRMGKNLINTLNDSQMRAIEHSLSSESLISLIHGPPGTGKTSTLAELIIQAVKHNQRILVCAPSNAAVDNLLDRVLNHDGSKGLQCIRLGHPARIDRRLLEHCLDSQLAQCDGREIIDDIKKEIDSLRHRPRIKASAIVASAIDSDRPHIMSKKERYSQLRQLQKDLRKYERKIVQDLLKTCHIIFATCVGASSSLLRDFTFDLVIIDEAAQGLEAEAWIPIIHGRRLVLAGDPNQLPPTIKSQAAVAGGLSVSLLERLMHQEKYQNVTYLLDTQYRMHHTICEWASNAMYDQRLLSHSSATDRSLNDWLPELQASSHMEASPPDIESYAVMTLIDTSGCELEEVSTVTGSRYNEMEGEVVRRYVSLLINAGAKADDIGIITPYSGQVSFLRSLFSSSSTSASSYPSILQDIAIRTVDGFQGGEKEIIILSMVRSNDAGEVGFLSDKRRINVAITRARRHLAVVGDMATCSENEFMSQLLEYISSHGDHRSAMELLQDDWIKMSLSYEPYVPDTISSDHITSELSSSSANNIKNKKKSHDNHKKTTTSSSTMKPSSASSPVSDDDFTLHLHDLLSAFISYSPLPIKSMNIVSATSSTLNKTLSFSSTISSFHRHLIHEACDKYPQLSHKSLGDGVSQQLTIYRPPEPTPVHMMHAPSIASSQLPSISSKASDMNMTSNIEVNDALSASSVKKAGFFPPKTKKKASTKKNIQSIGSTSEQIPDHIFTSAIQTLLTAFAAYHDHLIHAAEDQLLQQTNASLSDDHHILSFSASIPPHQRTMIKRSCLQHTTLRFDMVGDMHPYAEVSRPAIDADSLNTSTSVFDKLVDDDDFDDEESEVVGGDASATADVNISAKASSAAMNRKASAKDKKPKNGSNTKPKPKSEIKVKVANYMDMDEDEALMLAMEERRAYEHEHQYRLKSKAFPNNEKVKRQQYLHAMLQEAANDRIPKSAKESKAAKK